MAFEDNLHHALLSNNSEKTFIDKLLARNEVERIKELQRKDHLSKEELQELQYMCLSAESKLYNLSSHERNIILKYFVWIRDILQVTMGIYEEANHLPKFLSPKANEMIKNNKHIIESIIKFNVDLYLNILRTSLSLGGSAFFDMLNNRFEINYPHAQQQQIQQEPKGFFAKLGMR